MLIFPALALRQRAHPVEREAGEAGRRRCGDVRPRELAADKELMLIELSTHYSV
jgi:hypothetical protein